MEINENVNNWLKYGDRGTSSEAIVTVLTGVNIVNIAPKGRLRAPCDPSDFGRCLGLLHAVPEFRDRLAEMMPRSPKWATIVYHWVELEELYNECIFEKLSRCPKLYDRMKELGC